MEEEHFAGAPADLSRPVATSDDNESYTLSVAMAAELFTAAGLPRTERAIQRYCRNGELKCASADTLYGSKYLIAQSSVDRLIAQKKQAQQFTAETAGADTSRPDATGRDQSRNREEENEAVLSEQRDSEPAHRGDSQERAGDEEGDKARQTTTTDTAAPDIVRKLQEENLGLKIDVAGKQAFINQLVSEREQLMAATQDLSYRLGAADARVAQLDTPRDAHSVSRAPGKQDSEDETSASVGEGAAPVIQASGNPDSMMEPILPPSPPASKRSLFGRVFGK